MLPPLSVCRYIDPAAYRTFPFRTPLLSRSTDFLARHYSGLSVAAPILASSQGCGGDGAGSGGADAPSGDTSSSSRRTKPPHPASVRSRALPTQRLNFHQVVVTLAAAFVMLPKRYQKGLVKSAISFVMLLVSVSYQIAWVRDVLFAVVGLAALAAAAFTAFTFFRGPRFALPPDDADNLATMGFDDDDSDEGVDDRDALGLEGVSLVHQDLRPDLPRALPGFKVSNGLCRIEFADDTAPGPPEGDNKELFACC